MSATRLFLGYSRIEEWARVLGPCKPVYATRSAQRSGSYGAGGPEEYELAVVVSQSDSEGTVHYWRFTAAHVSMIGNLTSQSPSATSAGGALLVLSATIRPPAPDHGAPRKPLVAAIGPTPTEAPGPAVMPVMQDRSAASLIPDGVA
jgi:hypothetical protein